MSAAKKLHALRTEEPSVVIEANPSAEGRAQARDVKQAREAASQFHLSDRRKLTVSEKLSEGRGYWRGMMTGAMVGAAAGFGGTYLMLNTLVPYIMETTRDAIVYNDMANSFRPQAATPTGGAPPSE